MRARACLLLYLLLPVCCVHRSTAIHLVASAECGTFLEWQAVALEHSARKAGQQDPFTILWACNDSSLAERSKQLVSDSFFHINYAVHPRSGDRYPGYNKAASITHWLAEREPESEWVAILDTDMTIRTPITLGNTGVEKGRPVSAYYEYLEGVQPEVDLPIKHHLHNHSKAQRVGGFTIIHRDDLKEIARRWLPLSEEMREVPGNWGPGIGERFNQGGKTPPWIGEMYGYSFACAEAGLQFQVVDGLMLYPGGKLQQQLPHSDWPLILHYGGTWSVNTQSWSWAFEKKWFHSDRSKIECPVRTFQQPPTFSEIPDNEGTNSLREKKIMNLYCGWQLYNASVEYALKWCGEQHYSSEPQRHYSCYNQEQPMVYICREANADADLCNREDRDQRCCEWARKGECGNNANFMLENCAIACGRCRRREANWCIGEEEGRNARLRHELSAMQPMLAPLHDDMEKPKQSQKNSEKPPDRSQEYVGGDDSFSNEQKVQSRDAGGREGHKERSKNGGKVAIVVGSVVAVYSGVQVGKRAGFKSSKRRRRKRSGGKEVDV